MISFLQRKRSGPTFVLAILGDYGRVESALARTLACLEEIARRSDCQIVAALEDSRWETVPLVQTLGMRFPEQRLTVICGDYADQPARLFSAAAEHAEGRLHPVSLAGLPAAVRTRSPRHAAIWKAENSIGWALSVPWPACPSFVRRTRKSTFTTITFPAGDRWRSAKQWSDGRVSWRSAASARRRCCSASLTADYWLRSLRCGQKAAIRAGTLAESRWTWEDFPLQKDLRVPRYLSHSYRVRTADCPGDAEEAERLAKFAADLPPSLQATVERLTGVLPAAFAGLRPSRRPIRLPSPADLGSISTIGSTSTTPSRSSKAKGSSPMCLCWTTCWRRSATCGESTRSSFPAGGTPTSATCWTIAVGGRSLRSI